MKFAAIHKDSKGYIFTTMSKTISGLLVSTEPVIRVYKHENLTKIATTLREVLTTSKENVPNPSFNIFTADQKTEAKEKLKRLDLKSFKDLNKKPVLYCSVELQNNLIFLKPTARDSSGKGYVNTQKEEIIKVDFKASDTEIFNAIGKTFSNCE